MILAKRKHEVSEAECALIEQCDEMMINGLQEEKAGDEGTASVTETETEVSDHICKIAS